MDNKTLEIMKTRRSVRGFIPGKQFDRQSN